MDMKEVKRAVDWINLAWDRYRLQGLVCTVIELWGSINGG